MQNEKLLQTLKGVGLDEDEARVYLASLSLGGSSVLKISKLSGVKRTTTYGVIDSLQEKGLMGIELKGLKQIYTAESPEKLEGMLEQKKSQFQTKLPEFLALYKLKGGESTIKYHTGLRAMQNIYMETLTEIKSKEEYLVIANQEKWFNLDKEFAQNYIEDRSKLNIKTKLLFQNSKIAQEHKKFEKNYNQEVKILPAGNPLNVDTILLPNKMIVLELTPPYMTVVIENKSIVELHREMFEIIWRSLN